MRVIGLTGGIGMGKSFVARLFQRHGVRVHDADLAVHALLGPGGAAVAAVARVFPDVRMENRIDRAALGRKVTETLKRADAEGFARSSVDRALLWFMETPQCFRVNVLKRAYQHVRERKLQVTDEVSAVEVIGISTYLVESKHPNVKITVPADLKLAAYLMDARAQQ